MMDMKSQTRLADATVEMMRACALATARAASTSMSQSLAVWFRMLRSPAACGVLPLQRGMPRQLTWPLAADWQPADSHTAPADERPAEPDATQQDAAASDGAFASYRSSGGHAVAQVIVPNS